MLKILSKTKNCFFGFFKTKNREKGAIGLLETSFVISPALTAIAYFFGKDIAAFATEQILWLVYNIAVAAFSWSASIFQNIASSEVLKFAITKDNMVIHGWQIVRSLANMFIVLGFVVVGIATILRIREYEAQKKLLPHQF